MGESDQPSCSARQPSSGNNRCARAQEMSAASETVNSPVHQKFKYGDEFICLLLRNIRTEIYGQPILGFKENRGPPYRPLPFRFDIREFG